VLRFTVNACCPSLSKRNDRNIAPVEYKKIRSDLTNQIVRSVCVVKWGIRALSIFPHNDTSQNTCFCMEYLNVHYEDELFNSRSDKSCTMQLNVRLCSHLYDVLGDGVHNMVFHSRMPSGYHNQHQLGIHRVQRRQ
jgi:hypothetical protein